MRKTFLLLTAFTLALSCNSDDNSSSNTDQEPEPTTATLIKSVKINSPDSNGLDNIYTITFEYDDDKNVTKLIYSDSIYMELIYQNENIDKIISYNNGIQYSRTAYTYQNGKVIYGLIADGPEDINSERAEFSYNSNGKLSKYTTCGNPAGCESSSMSLFSDYIYSSNNITREIEGGFWTGEVSHQYDSYNNPFKNYDENFKVITNDFFSFPVCENNISKSIRTSPYNDTINYAITYNENNFPISVTATNSSGNLYVSYEYEYIEL